MYGDKIMKILAFDIGGTKISYAMVSQTGNLLSEVITTATPKKVEKIMELVQNAAAENNFDGVALATAGVVNKGQVLYKPLNLPSGYEKIDWARLVRKPILVENDANAAAWAEYKIGALKDYDNSLALTLGTGVGCGIIADGRILHGKSGAAGEVADFPISGPDLLKIAADNGVEEQDCFRLYAAVKNGNKAAKKAYEQWENSLVESLVLLNKVLDVERVAVSGSLAKIVDFAGVENAVNAKMVHNPISLKPAVCSNNAGLIGVALLLKNELEQR